MKKSHVTVVLTAVLVTACTGTAQAQQDPATTRIEAAQQAYEDAAQSLDMGTSTPEDVYRWSKRWLESVKLRDPESAAGAVPEHRARMEALKTKVDGLIASGMMPPSAGAACRYYVAEAAQWVEKSGP